MTVTYDAFDKSGQFRENAQKLSECDSTGLGTKNTGHICNKDCLLPQVKTSFRCCLQELQVFCSWAGCDCECFYGLNFKCGWDGKGYRSLSTCRVLQSECLLCLGLSVTSGI